MKINIIKCIKIKMHVDMLINMLINILKRKYNFLRENKCKKMFTNAEI
jgi:hypothetical protein